MQFPLCARVGALFAMVFACATFAQQPAPTANQAGRGAPDKNFFLYIGSFTGAAFNGHPDGGAPSRGIYMSHFSAATGTLSAPVLAAEAVNPTVVAVSPDQRFLYATTESSPEAFVTAYAIEPRTGALRMLNRLPTGGASTAYVSLDRTGRYVLLANYGSASVTVIQVNADGSLGPLTSFVQHTAPRAPRAPASEAPTAPPVPHPHATIASPDNRYIVVPDLGLNKLFVYKFDADTGVLTLPATMVDLSPNDAPRHFVFSPNGNFAYLVAQTWGNVDVFRWDAATGTLTPSQTADSFPKGLDATNMSAEIGITPNGKFLYESNRRVHGASHDLGPDSIVAFSVNAQTGALSQTQSVDLGASIPRCFTIDPTGSYIAVGGQQTNRIDLYRIDQLTGRLSNSGTSISLHTPACMQFARHQ